MLIFLSILTCSVDVLQMQYKRVSVTVVRGIYQITGAQMLSSTGIQHRAILQQHLQRGDNRIITVVFGVGVQSQRNRQIAKLTDMGFRMLKHLGK